jgi:hypothetical protein
MRRKILIVSGATAAVAVLMFILLRREPPVEESERALSRQPKVSPGSDFTPPKSSEELNAAIIKPFKPSPEKLSKAWPGWRALSNFVLGKETADLLELSPVEAENLDRCISAFVHKVSERLALDCVVAQDARGVHYVYFPGNKTKWKEIKESLESDLHKSIGSEKAAYLLDNSKLDFDLLTGGYGAYSRVARIEVVPPREDGLPTPPYHVRFDQGGSMLNDQNQFSQEIRNHIVREALTVDPWGAELYFDQPPAFLAGIIDFASTPKRSE